MMAAKNMEAGLRGRILFNEPMSRHTSWRVGGPADRYVEPADLDDLSCFLAGLPADEPLLWIGLGSNLLVRDGGIRGTVINTVNLAALDWTDEEHLRVEAGVPCAKVARSSAKSGYSGAEFLCGIPGTMGGAVAMNAGAFGGETWNIVSRVWAIDRQGRVHARKPNAYEIGYRRVRGPVAEWFVAAELKLRRDADHDGEQRIRTLLAKRTATQPTGVSSCGSVFRNPENDYAGRLIEQCGLKGHCIGGAVVSDKHANFIIAEPGATARDLEALINFVRAEVQRRLGVMLKPEVHIVGEAEAAE
ncbi:MAG: UDP-N-acetylmuramate dehydrogenase [Gammaproteobacteria bacterium]